MDINAPSQTLQPYTVIQPTAKPNPVRPPDALGQADFLRLLTTQLEQQDPLQPVENTEMLAQFAQFSALAGTTTTNDTLQQILGKLDNLIAVQTEANRAAAQNASPASPVASDQAPTTPPTLQE